MSAVRKECWFYLRYGSRPFCKKKAVESPSADFRSLDLGCPEDCTDYEPVEWRKPQAPPKEQLEELEWDDDEDDTNVGGRGR